MNRVLIIGRGSSGKSTFAAALSKILHIPVYHLDKYFWKQNWQKTCPEEALQIHQGIVNNSTWIIEGSTQFLEDRAKLADLFIVFDLPRYRTLLSWLHRMWKYRGKTRPDMAEGNVERLNPLYLMWQLQKKSDRKRAEMLSDRYPKTKLITFRSRKQANEYLKGIT